MKWIDEIPTPAILVERHRLEGNISTMQSRANTQGVALRPHTKTHKSVEVARMQQAAGATGLTVAKVGEAEVFADHGFDDLRIAYTVVGGDKMARIAELSKRVQVSFCVDTPEGARLASTALAGLGVTVDVLVEVDVGYGRCGVRWDNAGAIDLLQLVADLPGLRLRGILTHAGHAYNGPAMEGESEADALKAVMREERDRMLELAAGAARAGVPGVTPGDFEVSVGSTPSMRHFENAEHEGFRITEIRPGTYIYHDAIQVALGAATLDECAVTVQSTVISQHRNADSSERVFLDAGKKVFTSDREPSNGEHGILLYNPRVMEPLPHAHLTGLSEEHGWVKVAGGSTLNVGDQVRIVPAHVCVVINTQDHVYLVDGEEVVERWTVDTRGRVS